MKRDAKRENKKIEKKEKIIDCDKKNKLMFLTVLAVLSAVVVITVLWIFFTEQSKKVYSEYPAGSDQDPCPYAYGYDSCYDCSNTGYCLCSPEAYGCGSESSSKKAEEEKACYVEFPGIPTAATQPKMYIDCKCLKNITEGITLEAFKTELNKCDKIIKNEFTSWAPGFAIDIQLEKMCNDITSINPPPMTEVECGEALQIIKEYMQDSYGQGDTQTISGLGGDAINVDQIVKDENRKCKKINHKITNEYDLNLMKKFYEIVINKLNNTNGKPPAQNIYESDAFKNRKDLKCDCKKDCVAESKI